MALSSGFKKDALSHALELRAELDLANRQALDPHRLLAHLDIPVYSLTDLAAGNSDEQLAESTQWLKADPNREFSAMTVFRGTQRIVIHNDHNSQGRQAADLCHEAAHGLLLHPPAPPLDDLGCRNWNQQHEDEATWLGGELLIPSPGARYAAKAGWTFTRMATNWGCSEEMARWRNNMAGGQRWRRTSKPK